MLEPGRNATGDLWCAPIGMRGDDAGSGDVDALFMTNDDFDALLPRRVRRVGEAQRRRAARDRGLRTISRRRRPVRARRGARRRGLRDRRGAEGRGGRDARASDRASRDDVRRGRSAEGDRRDPRPRESLQCDRDRTGPRSQRRDGRDRARRDDADARCRSSPMRARSFTWRNFLPQLAGKAARSSRRTPANSRASRAKARSPRANASRACARSSKNTGSRRCSRAAPR